MTATLILATRNPHKVKEIRAMLPNWQVEDLSLLPEAPEVEESGVTFKENATLKALAISRLTGYYVLADDSGLEVEALNGDPGVYSARYAGREGSDAANNKKLLQAMSEVSESKRLARFRCVMVLARGGEVLGDFSGMVSGRILFEETGEGGFGYDPLFAPDGHEKSFAELGSAVKNTLSHRARALEGVADFLSQISAK